MTIEHIKNWIISKPENRLMTDIQTDLAAQQFAEFNF